MKTKHDAGSRNDCRHRRLAQGSIAAVDVCACGNMQVHIGTLTLRLTPPAVSDLLATLGQAVAAHAAQRNETELLASFASRERGEA